VKQPSYVGHGTVLIECEESEGSAIDSNIVGCFQMLLEPATLLAGQV